MNHDSEGAFREAANLTSEDRISLSGIVSSDDDGILTEPETNEANMNAVEEVSNDESEISESEEEHDDSEISDPEPYATSLKVANTGLNVTNRRATSQTPNSPSGSKRSKRRIRRHCL